MGPASRDEAPMMPEDQRDGLYDPAEEFPWDFDNAYPIDLEEDEEE